MRGMGDHDWLTGAQTALHDVSEAGALLVLAGPAPDAGLDALASGAGLDRVDVHASSWGALTDGVSRACAREYLEDPEFCADAVEPRLWAVLEERWGGGGGELGLPPDDQGFRRATEVLARVLAEVGEVAGRVVVVHDAAAMDEGSARAFTALLAGRAGAGWVLVLEGPIDDAPHVDALIAAVERRDADAVARLEPPAAAGAGDDDGGPGLPKQGSAVELLDVLSAAPGPVPADVVGSDALARYRGTSPRSGWVDLQGLIDAGRASLDGPLVRLAGSWAPTTDRGSAVAKADCRALRGATEEVSPDAATAIATLAVAGGSADASALATAAGRSALAAGDARAAAQWLAQGSAADDPHLPALRARAARLTGDAEEARRLALEGLKAATDEDVTALLNLEAALAAQAVGKIPAARRHAIAAANAAADGALEAACKLLLGTFEEEAEDYGPAAKTLGEAAQASERLGQSPEAARALAWRAVCMGKAGAGPRAMKELQLARERVADPNDPHPASLDVRILMGMVFRDSGSRDNARKALAMAAEKAHEHADPVREADARLMLARFFLEAIPVRGPERGEALRDGREAAEEVVRIARGMGRPDVEAEGEALLGELSYRAEDFAGALASLDRQAALWEQVGRANQQVDVAIRRSRLAGRQGDAEGSFKAANEALMLATKRRLPEQSAQAQLARADALEKLDRGSDALAALSEAQRIFTSLGDGFAGQAAAAEERARNLVARSSGG